MSRFTSVRSDVWNDSEFEDLSPEGKLIYIYLLTSPLCNAAGYYKIKVSQIALDTGISESVIYPELTSQKKLWKYDTDTKQVLITNYLKYNTAVSGSQIAGLESQVKPLEKCPLHVDFYWAVHKYCGSRGDGMFTLLDDEGLRYLISECKNRPGYKPAEGILDILNNIVT